MPKANQAPVDPAYRTAEAKARVEIDQQLAGYGWFVAAVEFASTTPGDNGPG